MLSFRTIADIAFANSAIRVFHALNNKIDEEIPWHNHFPLYFSFYSQHLNITMCETHCK